MKSLKSFVFILGACIGVPTYIMAIRPYAKERERQPVPYQAEPDPKNPSAPAKDPETAKTLYYPQSYAGDNKRGELVYAREGCAQCHTQIIRPDYAGNDQIKRFSGREQEFKKDVPTPVRQTHPWDYMHEDFAMFGQRRIGPDLSNAGYRFSDKEGKPDPAKVANLYQHLYAPRSIQGRKWSNSPSFKHLFQIKEKESDEGRGDALKLKIGDDLDADERDDLLPEEGFEIVPTEEAKALAGYILGLKRDYPIPSSITGIQPKAEK